MAYNSGTFPKISFGIIVLNGEPFTKYCLRQLYPHAHEIIVVEGGSEKAISVAPEGHSTDGTLRSLQEFKDQEDIEDKVQIVTKDGFWSEKDEQSQAYAERATGDYLWQVDIDEFYRHEDIKKVRSKLARERTIDTASFTEFTFWGSPYIITDSFYLISDRENQFHRLFKWGPGYTYKSHRPPTVLDNEGVDLKKKNWVTGDEMARDHIFLYHYSLLFPLQVTNKCLYYSTPWDLTHQAHVPGILKWAENCYFFLRHPFRVHNAYKSISWLKHFSQTQPEEALLMWDDATSGKLHVQLRDNQDAEQLIRDPFYRMAAAFMNVFALLLKLSPFSYGRRLYFFFERKYKKIFNLGLDAHPPS